MNNSGPPRHPDRTRYTFHFFITHTSLPLISFPSLRHAHVTLLQAGRPAKEVPGPLGHKSHSVTMDLDAHVMPGP
jgi:hypothetical protein